MPQSREQNVNLESKPIIIFTNFWDAEEIVRRKYCFLEHNGKILYVQLVESKIFPFAISISHPSKEKIPFVSSHPSFRRINELCPTLSLSSKYTANCPREEKIKLFKETVKSKKSQIIQWLNSLEKGNIYILCCWEKTSCKISCYRQQMFNLLSKSKQTVDKAFYFYREGEIFNPNLEREMLPQIMGFDLSKDRNMYTSTSAERISEEMNRYFEGELMESFAPLEPFPIEPSMSFRVENSSDTSNFPRDLLIGIDSCNNQISYVDPIYGTIRTR